jgi:hypothetical protein
MTNFQDETQNLAKSMHFQKNHISPNLIVKKHLTYWEIINTIYNFLKNISFENSSLGKHIFWEKGPQKG